MSDGRIGPFRLVRPLGTGGMGQVWEAVPEAGGAPVALKRLIETGSRARFLAEMALTKGLDHPNLVRVVDCGMDGDQPWLAMELLHGATFAALRRQRPEPWPPALVVALAVQVLEALQALHARGIVHRDLKPSNLFLTSDGTVRVIDFGIAFHTTEDRTQTKTGVVMGSVRYASPEQAKGEPVTSRSDLFSFGLTLFELLSGRRALDQPTDLGVVSALMFQTLPRLAEALPEARPELDAAVAAALEREPAQRVPTAKELEQRLVEAVDGRLWSREDIAHWLQGFELRESTGQMPAPPPRPMNGSSDASVGSREVQASPGPRSTAEIGEPSRRRSALVVTVGVLAVAAAAVLASRLAGSMRVDALDPASHRPSTQEARPATGISPTGISPTGTSPTGTSPTGTSPTGTSPTGTSPTGTSPTGTSPTGTSPTGTSPTGTSPTGTSPTGTSPTGTSPTGTSPTSTVAAPRPSSSETKPPSRHRKRTDARAPDSPGWLTLSMQSGWGKVFVDGKALGETPLFRVPLAAGTHRVEVVSPDGRRQRRQVTVRAESEARVVFAP